MFHIQLVVVLATLLFSDGGLLSSGHNRSERATNSLVSS